MRTLIVEDDFTARKLMQTYLRELGDCFVAVNGKEAIEAFTQGLTDDERYDLICLDIMMPEMGGIEALKIIREIEHQHGIEGLDRVKVIMTTASEQPENIFGAFRVGCEAYIVKPVRKPKLFEEIQDLGLLQGQHLH